MVQFRNDNSRINTFRVMVNNVHRFDVREKEDFAGGWRLMSIASDWYSDFATLCEVETYIEEMDK